MELTPFQAFLVVTAPVFLGLVAVGAVLPSKIARRRDASQSRTGSAGPTTAALARAYWRRYFAAAALIVAAWLVVAGLVLWRGG